MPFFASKAEKIRHTRQCARVIKSRRGVFSRMLTWTQENVGEANEKHTIELRRGWSFDPEKPVMVKDFRSVDLAMIGIKKAFKMASDFPEEQMGRQERLALKKQRTWNERLEELKKVGHGKLKG